MGFLIKENLLSINIDNKMEGVLKVNLTFKNNSRVCIAVYDGISIEQAVNVTGDVSYNRMEFINSIANEVSNICVTLLGSANIALLSDHAEKEFLSKWEKVIFFNIVKSYSLHEKVSYEDAIQVVNELYSIPVIDG